MVRPQIGCGCCKVSIRARHCWRANGGCRNFQTLRPVSIRARHCWRANFAAWCWAAAALGFQSAPAIAGGRIQRPPRHLPQHPCFNPRPPLLAGESQPPAASATCALFQSAPAIAGGRIPVCPGIAPGTAGFNPRPPLLAGESSQAGGHPLFMGVSIRARHCWRANAGRGADGQFQHVSIRARHCWRANLTGWRFTGTRKSFNPRPPLLAGESGFCDFCAGVRQFQSAPAIAGGRMVRHQERSPICSVSIRARHCWRANAALLGSVFYSALFQDRKSVV